ncbi:procollagen galactosyltransferase 1 [Holospora obtusa F1]|uniref:Procollagen galactosyltransferase 1 n=1 Tax=Holospora obtusa F1 TaxID=1399147 RepID=W6TDX7_HOLOB|nr:procollagen galactosyltransferase 1 [Holospora obtusa F1]
MIDTYIINLERAKERWDKIITQLSPYPEFRIKKIIGVDGKYENFSKIHLDSNQSIRYFGQALSSGTIGCYLSHVKAWKTFCCSGKNYAFILEDDASFNPLLVLYLLKKLGIFHENSLNDTQKSDWDICSLQLNHRGMPLPIQNLQNGYELCTYLTSVTGAGAYVLSQHSAQRLLYKAFPIILPVDHYYTKSHRLDLKFVGIEPRTITQSAEFSFIERIGRERLKNISSWSRIFCGMRRVKEELHQSLYNLKWALPLYCKYRFFK